LGSLCATYNMKPQFSSFLDCKHYCNILFFYQNPVSIYLTFTDSGQCSNPWKWW